MAVEFRMAILSLSSREGLVNPPKVKLDENDNIGDEPTGWAVLIAEG